MKREEYCCIIGYQGGEALVDKSALKAVKGLSSRELADKGLYRAAMASAVYEASNDDQNYIFQVYKDRCDSTVENSDQLLRMLGIYPAFKENIPVKLV